MRRVHLGVWAIPLLLVSAWSPGSSEHASPAAPEAADDRPNIVVFMTDDQTLEQMRALGRVSHRIGANGVTFDDFVVSYPLCCPSRATLFTGQYSHNHGIWSIYDEPLPPPVESGGDEEAESWTTFNAGAEATSMAVALEEGGYHTGLLGKYLAGYGRGASWQWVPPGWTDWAASVDPWTKDYWNTRISSNGTIVDFAGQYQTDAFASWGESMIDRASESQQPFFLFFSFFAPHIGARAPSNRTLPWPEVAPRHQRAYATARAPRGAAYNERSTRDKPRWIQQRYPRLTRGQRDSIDQRYRRELQSLRAVDEAVDRLLDRLQVNGELDNTLVIFTSDNGYYHGEHRIRSRKFFPYEPVINVPLLVAGPMVSTGVRGRHLDDTVANVDLAPTILDYAGATSLRPTDGRSLRPLLEGRPEEWTLPSGRFGRPPPPRPIYLAGVRGGCSAQCPVTFSGVRVSDRWSYWRWQSAGRPAEMYSLARDPEQLRNRAGAPHLNADQASLERQRRLLLRCSGPSCDTPPYGYLDLPSQGEAMWRSHAHWADTSGLGAAYADGTFRPRRPISREEILDWLWRSAGRPNVGSTNRQGVPRVLRRTIGWAEAEGVLRQSNRRSVVGRPVLRVQAIDWMWNLAGQPPASSNHGFIDVSENRTSIQWAREAGVVESTERFRPQDSLQRTNAVVWVHRFATLDPVS